MRERALATGKAGPACIALLSPRDGPLPTHVRASGARRPSPGFGEKRVPGPEPGATAFVVPLPPVARSSWRRLNHADRRGPALAPRLHSRRAAFGGAAERACAMPRSGSSGPAQPRDRFRRSQRSPPSPCTPTDAGSCIGSTPVPGTFACALQSAKTRADALLPGLRSQQGRARTRTDASSRPPFRHLRVSFRRPRGRRRDRRRGVARFHETRARPPETRKIRKHVSARRAAQTRFARWLSRKVLPSGAFNGILGCPRTSSNVIVTRRS